MAIAVPGMPEEITVAQVTEALRILGFDADHVYALRVGQGIVEAEVWCPVYSRSDQFPNTHTVRIRVVPSPAPGGAQS